MKKFINYLLVLCLIVPCVFLLAGCKQNDAASEMTLSVNPEVSFILNANDKVLSVKYENADASMIYADVNFVGKDVDATIQLFIERAAISGHVDLAGDEVSIQINGKSSADVEALKTKAKAKVESVFENLGVAVEVNVANLSLEAQKEALKATAKVLAPEKSLKELDEMSNEELLQLINTKQKELKDLTYEQAQKVNDLYSSAKNTVLQAVESTREALEKIEAQLNELEQAYSGQIPEVIKTQINTLKAQMKQMQEEINAKVNEFLDARKEDIKKAQKEYQALKEQLKTEFKTQVETSKQNVINHLTTSKNNGTITEEQYNYWVSLIENQTK